MIYEHQLILRVTVNDWSYDKYGKAITSRIKAFTWGKEGKFLFSSTNKMEKVVYPHSVRLIYYVVSETPIFSKEKKQLLFWLKNGHVNISHAAIMHFY